MLFLIQTRRHQKSMPKVQRMYKKATTAKQQKQLSISGEPEEYAE